MAHTCHAAGCTKAVPPEMFMCKKHWFSLPKRIRDEVWRTYRPGQCDDWEITHAYAEAARAGVTFVAEREGVADSVLREALRVYDMLDPVRYGERVIEIVRDGTRQKVKL